MASTPLQILIEDTYEIVVIGATPTTGPFTFTFPFFSLTNDVKIKRTDAGTGVVTDLTVTTDYTVAGNSVDGGYQGGTITLTSSDSDATLTIYRDLAVSRTDWFPNSGPFDITTLNQTLARIYAISQELNEEVDRGLTLPITEAGTSLELPELATRANKFLAFNASGEPIAAETVTAGVVATAFAETLLDDANAAAFLTTLGVTSFAQTLLDDATAADARTTLGVPLGSAASQIAVNDQNWTTVASATTTDIGAAATTRVNITGTTTITGLGTATAGLAREVRFDGALTLTYNATSLILPGNANITTAAGDTAKFVSEGSGNWRCLQYTVRAASPGGGGLDVQTFTTSGADTWTKPVGFDASSPVLVEAWGGGASGGTSSTGGAGGGGGGYNRKWFVLSDLGATESLTIAAGGAGQSASGSNGNAGGNTNVGTLLYAYGGGRGNTSQGGGGGGGTEAAGQNGGATGGDGGNPFGGTGGNAARGEASWSPQGGGGGGDNGFSGGSSVLGGGGGAGGDAISVGQYGGSSVWGGGGGGAGDPANDSEGGRSTHGGNGGAGGAGGNGVAGTQPGGGGGGCTNTFTSGAGADGMVRITVYPI